MTSNIRRPIPTATLAPTEEVMPLIVKMLCKIPIEKIFHDDRPVVLQGGTVVATIEKPGCTVADECLVAMGHLEGLARGNGGFGVLRLSAERLEVAAVTAVGMNQPSLAREIRSVSGKLSRVHSPEAAESLASELRPVADRAWRLGRVCGLTRQEVRS